MEEKHVFGKGYTGGPHNFGDPNDRSMRHVEDNIFVTQIIRNRGIFIILSICRLVMHSDTHILLFYRPHCQTSSPRKVQGLCEK